MPSRSSDLAGGRPCPRPNEEKEMPKIKTKASAKKRFRFTASGKVRANFACKNHMLRRRSQKMKRKARGTMLLSAADSRIIKSYMPNG